MAGKLRLDWADDHGGTEVADIEQNPTKKTKSTRKAAPGRLATAVINSDNPKVGKALAIYGAQVTCPGGHSSSTGYVCPLLKHGCYAEDPRKPVSWTTKALNKYAAEIDATPQQVTDEMVEKLNAAHKEWSRKKVNNFVRMHVVGDCTTTKQAQDVSAALEQYVTSSSGVKNIWNYTHAWRKVPRSAWLSGMSVLASCDSLDDLPKAHAKGYACAMVMSKKDMEILGGQQNKEFGKEFMLPNGFRAKPCQYEISSIVGTKGKQCVDCKWCMLDDTYRSSKTVIVFAAHTKGAEEVANELINIDVAELPVESSNPCHGGGRGSLQNPFHLLYITPHKAYADELSAHLWKHHGIRNTILHHARDNNYEVVLLHPDSDYREAKKVVADFMDEKAHMRSWLDKETAKESNPEDRVSRYGVYGSGSDEFRSTPRRKDVLHTSSLSEAKVAFREAAKDYPYAWLVDFDLDERPILSSSSHGVISKVRRSTHYVPGRKSNPEDTAAEMFETFHGKKSEEILEVGETVHFHGNLAVLGELVEMKVATLTKKDAEISFSDSGCVLCSNEAGTQLYVVGGDQALDLEKLGFTGDKLEKDMVTVGVLYELTYQTAKGFDKFKLTDYYHELGEETGFQPMMIYDRLNDFILISGGEYKIKAEGIVN